MANVPTGKLVDLGENHRPPSYENHSVYTSGISQSLKTFAPGTKCEGAYDFSTVNKGDLKFKKGELLTVLASTRDPNWYKAQNSKGEQGMVPANYIIKKANQDSKTKSNHKEVKLTAMPWFHGKITRQVAEELLQPRHDGLFLVRESTNYPGDYTMCVCYEDDVEHYRIIFKNNKVTIDEEEYFENLTKLVSHYEHDADGLVCRLSKPLKKKGGLDYTVDTEDFRKAGWTIDRKLLELGQILGKGDFGDVYEGQYKGEKVAVKSVKDRSKAAQAFLAEASVMTSLNHKNLIQLKGVVIPPNNSTDPIYVVLEFMTKGALLEYLRSRGRSYVSSKNLLQFAKDIANGMAYLEQKKLVHRDLAARNILISEEGIAKVSDFGLARDSSFNLQGGKFPVKWTAPEALKEGALKDLLNKIMAGYRMDRPEQCEQKIYAVMQKCWLEDPVERYSFAKIVKELDNIKL